MDVSSELKFNMQYERQAALSLEKALDGVSNNASTTFDDIKAGVERASWYSSCLFDKYKDVCKGLYEEDKRFILSMAELFKKRDIILFMVVAYISFEISKVKKDGESRSSREQVREFDRKVAGLLSKYTSGKMAKSIVANTIATMVMNSYSFKSEALRTINSKTLVIITWVGFYGKVQQAARSASNLKFMNRLFYDFLYSNNIEMLYFVIEPMVKKAERAAMNKSGEDRFISIISELVR